MLQNYDGNIKVVLQTKRVEKKMSRQLKFPYYLNKETGNCFRNSAKSAYGGYYGWRDNYNSVLTFKFPPLFLNQIENHAGPL